jgi:hypothetical protein
MSCEKYKKILGEQHKIRLKGNFSSTYILVSCSVLGVRSPPVSQNVATIVSFKVKALDIKIQIILLKVGHECTPLKLPRTMAIHGFP